MKKIVELLIDWDNLEFDELGVDIMSLVDKPAIQTSWMAFAEEMFVEPRADESESDFIGRCIPVLIAEGYSQEQATAICYSYWQEGFECPTCDKFESITDYPEAVKEAAARGIRLNEELGNPCATQVGKVRAQQLAQGKPISEETVRRMYSYLSRAAEYYNPDDTEACGTISYLLWGGEAALKWSERYLQQREEEMILEAAEKCGEYVDYKDVTYIDISQTEFSTIGDFLKGVTALDILGRRVNKDEEAVTKYRYAGPPAERNFCKAMQRMNKLYTRREIDEMSQSINTGFRHRPGDAYSIFNFKGGVNCKHYWEELSVFRGENGQFVMISHGPARGRAGEIASSANNYWRFSDEDQRIVTGPAMIPDRLILRRDELGNPFHVYFSKETIKKINEKFMKNAAHNTDINHNDDVTTENTLLESWIVDDPQYDKSTKLGFNVPTGTWMVSYRINDNDTWNKIKNGELNGFSVTGNFIEKLQK